MFRKIFLIDLKTGEMKQVSAWFATYYTNYVKAVCMFVG